MNILILMKLSDKTMRYHVYPVSKLNNVEEISIVRDNPGLPIPKVKYYCPPPKILIFPIISFIYKQLLLIILSVYKNPDIILGFLLFPHGLILLLTGIFTHKKTAIVLIAGPLEVYEFGTSPIGKYPYNEPLPPLKKKEKVVIKVLNLFNHIIVAGSFTKNFLTINGISGKKIFIIPYSIDKNENVISNNKIYDLIYIGRIEPVKHVETLIYITQKLIAHYNNIKVVIIGDGSQLNNIYNLSVKLHLKKHILFTGHVQNVNSYLNESKIFIHTSERDTGPFTVLEAMQHGLPIISSKCGDMVNDIIINGFNGFLIEGYNDVDSYINKICLLLSNKSIYSIISNNSKRTSGKLTHYNISKYWSKLFNKG